MKAILPVAGIGSRLKPHTLNRPKALLPLVGKPILGYIIDRLISVGVDEIIFIVGYLGQEIIDYVATNYADKVSVKFVWQEETLGLGHAVYMGKEFIGSEDDLLVILGDTIIDANLKTMINKSSNGLGVKTIEDPRRFGVAVTNNRGDITKVVEKPKEFVSNLALVGLYYFTSGLQLMDSMEKVIEKNIKVKNEYQLTSALELMIENGSVFKTIPVDAWYDCGDLPTLIDTNNYLLNKLNSQTIFDSENNNIFIEPYFLGKDCKISNSIIGPHTSVADSSEIFNSIIKNSIIGESVSVEDLILENSVIGSNSDVTGFKLNVSLSDNSEFRI